MGKTYIWIRDPDASVPEPTGDSGPIGFNIYNEAMSYAKWLSSQAFVSSQTLISVWNHDGGSGYWLNATFYSLDNDNYPS